MANTTIDKRVEGRADLTRGLEAVRTARGLPVQGDGKATGFSSVLASLDGVAGFAAGAVDAALPGLDGLAQAAAAAMGLESGGRPASQGGSVLANSPDTGVPILTADALLLASQGQMPWSSLVGQTAQLDGKADRDLVQGAAGDWLSGRGNAALAMLRQEQGLAQGQAAHAAFMAPASTAAAQDTASPLDAAALAQAAGADAPAPALAGTAGRTGLPASAPSSEVLAAMGADGAATSASAARAAAPGTGAHAAIGVDAAVAGLRHDMALASGIAVQGMAAVKPEEWRGLFERAREGGTAASEAVAPAAHGVAAAVGAAHAGQQAGQQAGQDASAFAQPQGSDAAPASEREQEISEQVAFWVHNKSQNASLSVEHEGRAIQVQVSLQGNEAHVRFGSSEAQAREWLGQGAEQLRELLQAQGLQLAGVSVDTGAAGGESERQGGRDQARQGRVSAMVDAGGVSEGRPAAAGAGRAAGGGVDLFV
ncbi:MAG: flagellar hook-length control protein FliK [Burkholderiaceae bacterium]|jgi:flagellar hook-length control protein FliK|nr:flagellar hook-length control protein FliK [Burkholderiaceae bacterium]